jgi:hypothetical protein
MLPVLAAGVYLAGLVALWGVLSLLLNREVVDYRDAGPLLGPAMAAGACIVTWLVSWRLRGWASSLVALAGSFAAMLLVAAVGYTLTRGDLSWMLVAAAHFAISPFVLGAAALSALVVLGVRAIHPVKNG